MPANQRRLFLLAYDIADPRRLVRVHRTVRNHGVPLQYSLFLVPGTAADIDQLLAQLDEIIAPTEDDIRVYPLPQMLDVVQYGRQWMPHGIETETDGHVGAAIMVLVGAGDATGPSHREDAP